MEPEFIVDHRKIQAKVLYKIHWRGLGQEEETWTPAEDFQNKALLKAYWTFHLDPNNQRKGSGRRKYVPEYIQQFYRDYLQNPLIDFPDFQPEVDKPRQSRPKKTQQESIIEPPQYQEEDLLQIPAYPDKRVYENAEIIGHYTDGGSIFYKVKLSNGNIISLNRGEASNNLPKQYLKYIEDNIPTDNV